jgi:hypothetical protein
MKVPRLADLSLRESEMAITAFSEQFPGGTEDMLVTAAEINNSTLAVIGAIAERLHRRNQDISDLESIVKSVAEVTKKIDRLCRRMTAEGRDART